MECRTPADPLLHVYCEVCHNIDPRGDYRVGTADTLIDGLLSLEDRKRSSALKARERGCVFCGLLCGAFGHFVGEETGEETYFDLEIAEGKPCFISIKGPASCHLELYAPRGMYGFANCLYHALYTDGVKTTFRHGKLSAVCQIYQLQPTLVKLFHLQSRA